MSNNVEINRTLTPPIAQFITGIANALIRAGKVEAGSVAWIVYTLIDIFFFVFVFNSDRALDGWHETKEFIIYDTLLN